MRKWDNPGFSNHQLSNYGSGALLLDRHIYSMHSEVLHSYFQKNIVQVEGSNTP